MTTDFNAAAVEKYGIAGGAALPDDAAGLRKMFEHIYHPMKERYGDWHGFNEDPYGCDQARSRRNIGILK